MDTRIIAAGLIDAYRADDILDLCRDICNVVRYAVQQIILEVSKRERSLLKGIDVKLPFT